MDTLDWDGGGLSLGAHTLTLTVTDLAGNTFDVTMSINLEAAPPVEPPAEKPSFLWFLATKTPTPLPTATQVVSTPTATRTQVVEMLGAVPPVLLADESALPETGSPDLQAILWGAAAAGVIAAATAYSLEEKRKREEEEARQRAKAEMANKDARAREKGYESYADMLEKKAKAAFNAQWNAMLAEQKTRQDAQLLVEQVSAAKMLTDFIRNGENPPLGYEDMTESERLDLYTQTAQYREYLASIAPTPLANPTFDNPPAKYNQLYTNLLPLYYGVINGQLFARGVGDSTELEVTDFKQGGAPDCAFISALITIVKQQPALLQTMIRDNYNDTYTVGFYTVDQDAKPTGSRTYITVDNQIPLNNRNRPVFAKLVDIDINTNAYELYPLLFEKAFAVYEGGTYWETSTSGARAMTVLTGCESESYLTQDLELRDLIALADQLKNGYGMTADALQNGNGLPLYQSNQLYYKHVYSVLEINITGLDLSNNTAGNVVLRNPWGESATITLEEFLLNINKISTNPLICP